MVSHQGDNVPHAGDLDALSAGGNDRMLIIGVWNRNYGLRTYVCGSIKAAVKIAMKQKHIQGALNVRKIADLTEKYLAEEPRSQELLEIIGSGKIGELIYSEAMGWELVT